MRGCNNFCTYCIVPYTRGRERSRDIVSILNEIRDMHEKGFKEVTLLGQNVNSYSFEKEGETITFPILLDRVAKEVPDMRIRFTTSHPKDMSDDTLRVIAANDNICKFIHLPAQSGSSRILKVMNRVKWDMIVLSYLNIPNVRVHMPLAIWRIMYRKKRRYVVCKV